MTLMRAANGGVGAIAEAIRFRQLGRTALGDAHRAEQIATVMRTQLAAIPAVRTVEQPYLLARVERERESAAGS